MTDRFVVVIGTYCGVVIVGDDAVPLLWNDAGVDSIRNSFGSGGLSSDFAFPIRFYSGNKRSIKL